MGTALSLSATRHPEVYDQASYFRHRHAVPEMMVARMVVILRQCKGVCIARLLQCFAVLDIPDKILRSRGRHSIK